ncbi:MAG TPA: Arc family DNA-binding protein [Geminicoccus sp.]|uniref:FitA-like ribbon-helix-helix domain-containing protein n=1 Tax=Geminicoccus TaxID=489140 RepID=UPI00168B6A53|nr:MULTISPECIES: Arc family DNA-binding protein [Geminicoccus]HWL70937.1 Arc family DNA-binding protein [Geminicoccus sp.]
MATILVRNVDDAVVERLKAQAKEHGRSMEAEVRALLTEAAGPPGDLTGEALWEFLRSGPKVTEDFELDIPDDYSIPPNPFEDE